MNIPGELKYTKDHEWIKIDGETATVGITDFAQGELGDVVYVEIETEGDNVAKEATFGTIEAVKTVSDLFMPMSGTIKEVNKALEADPEVVNKDPYGAGWMVKITLDNANEVDDLLSADEYKALIG